MILLHGLTTSGEMFTPVARYLQQYLPNTRFVLPTAPKCRVTWADNQIVTGWYNLQGDNFTLILLIVSESKKYPCKSNSNIFGLTFSNNLIAFLPLSLSI
ncbi:hypothetical protein [Neisseria iguanae]|uniref:hypothetical protein n=1 Tax=Neisseria iguanae TaxID=90242 RepID=UPI001B80C110|nr:hypothetical protein [Neisseria iguanae]